MALKIFSKHKPVLNFTAARLKGKKMAIIIKIITKKNVHRLVIDKNLHNAETKFIIQASPFFYG